MSWMDTVTQSLEHPWTRWDFKNLKLGSHCSSQLTPISYLQPAEVLEKGKCPKRKPCILDASCCFSPSSKNCQQSFRPHALRFRSLLALALLTIIWFHPRLDQSLQCFLTVFRVKKFKFCRMTLKVPKFVLRILFLHFPPTAPSKSRYLFRGNSFFDVAWNYETSRNIKTFKFCKYTCTNI